MPIFTDKIVLEDLGELALSEFNFQTTLLKAPLSGYRLKENGRGQHEFVSTDVTYKLPQKVFGKGNLITLIQKDGREVRTKVRVADRQFYKAEEAHFKRLVKENVVDNDYFVKIDCELSYTQEEMDWILRGYAPMEMEDRIVMYAKTDRILIYNSWNGGLIFEAKFRQKLWGRFVIHQLFARKRKVTYDLGAPLRDFKQRIESQFLTHRHYIEKWSQDYYDRNKL